MEQHRPVAGHFTIGAHSTKLPFSSSSSSRLERDDKLGTLLVFDFPNDLLTEIFSYLDWNTLVSVSLVSQQWNNITRSGALRNKIIMGTPFHSITLRRNTPTFCLKVCGEFLFLGSTNDSIFKIGPDHEYECMLGHSSWITSLESHPTRPILYSGSHDRTIRRWDLSKDPWTQDVLLSRSSSDVFGATIWGNHLFWADDALIRSIPLPEEDKLTSDTQNAEFRQDFTGTGLILCLRVWPTANALCSGSVDGLIRLWTRSGSNRRTFRGHKEPVLCLEPWQRLLFSGSKDKTIRVWSIDGCCLRIMSGCHNGIVGLRMFGRILCSVSYDRSLRFWQAGGLCFTIENAHRTQICDIDIWNDSVCTAGGDGVVKWKPETLCFNWLSSFDGCLVETVD
eukprot:TRINITY_DN1595_c0_g3_i1.p1 TRINITY_DN1595_c0_g3~~TRINITY_DN1595_c0_g3_i1.p1  ORF type:complete len:414 (-),score=46.78 TRINITY_DN1595_c0_g3_i1:9-1190(-)